MPRGIVVVGSINMDLVSRVQHLPAPGETVTGIDFQTHPGGKGANQAVAAGRLGCPVQLIGRVGDDQFGEELRQHLGEAGVDTSAVHHVPGSSGVATILVSSAGENSIVVTPGANAALTPSELDRHLDLLGGASLVLTQLEIPLPTIVRLAELCQQVGAPLMLDPAPAIPLPEGLLASCTWITPNETEAAFYIQPQPPSPPAMLRAFRSLGATGVILKLGARGVYLGTPDGQEIAQPAFPVEPVDTTAAGDAFNGAFAAALLLRGESPAASARFASAAAAISVTRHGAQPSMPSMEEVERFLEQYPAETT